MLHLICYNSYVTTHTLYLICYNSYVFPCFLVCGACRHSCPKGVRQPNPLENARCFLPPCECPHRQVRARVCSHGPTHPGVGDAYCRRGDLRTFLVRRGGFTRFFFVNEKKSRTAAFPRPAFGLRGGAAGRRRPRRRSKKKHTHPPRTVWLTYVITHML